MFILQLFIGAASSPFLKLAAPWNILAILITLLTSHGVVPVPKLELNDVAPLNIVPIITDAVGDVFIVQGN